MCRKHYSVEVNGKGKDKSQEENLNRWGRGGDISPCVSLPFSVLQMSFRSGRKTGGCLSFYAQQTQEGDMETVPSMNQSMNILFINF